MKQSRKAKVAVTDKHLSPTRQCSQVWRRDAIEQLILARGKMRLWQLPPLQRKAGVTDAGYRDALRSCSPGSLTPARLDYFSLSTLFNRCLIVEQEPLDDRKRQAAVLDQVVMKLPSLKLSPFCPCICLTSS